MGSARYNGEKLQGSHTTTVQETVKLLRTLENETWLHSVRIGILNSKCRFGGKSLSIGRHPEAELAEKTLKIIMKANGAVQELFFQLEESDLIDVAVERIAEVARKKIKGIEIRLRDSIEPDES